MRDCLSIVWYKIVVYIVLNVIKYKKTRKREIIHARHLCRKFIKENTLLSLAQVGKFTMGDHTSVLHSMSVVSNFVGTDKPFTNSYNLVLKKIELTFMQSSYSNTQIKLAKILKASDGISKEQMIEMIEDMLINE